MSQFFRVHKEASGNVGEYIFTIAGIVASVFIGSFVSQIIAQALNVNMFGINDGNTSNLVLGLSLLPFLFPVLFLFLITRKHHKLPVLSLFTSREKFDWRRFFTLFLIWTGINVLQLVLAFQFDGAPTWNFNLNLFVPLVVVAILLLPIQTLAEELIFRSYLFQFLGKLNLKPIVAVVFLSLLFASLHAGNPEVNKFGNWLMIFYALNGLFLGLITALDNGIELSYGFHLANNLFGVLIVSFESSALPSESLFIMEDDITSALPTVAFFLITVLPIFFYLYKKYKWNFKELLANS